MEGDAHVNVLKLLNQSYQNVKIRITLEHKALTIRCGGKTERFLYKKMKEGVQDGQVLFQSDGLKLILSPTAKRVEQILSGAVASGMLETEAPTNGVTTNSNTVKPKTYIGSDRVSREPLTRPVVVSSKSSVSTTSRSDISSSVVFKQPTSISPAIADNGQPYVTAKSSEKSSFTSPRKSTPPRVALDLRKKHSDFDWYQENTADSPLSPTTQPRASPDTLFPTTATSQVASPIPTKMRKYGTAKTAAIMLPVSRPLFPVSTSKSAMRLGDHTPHSHLYGSSDNKGNKENFEPSWLPQGSTKLTPGLTGRLNAQFGNLSVPPTPAPAAAPWWKASAAMRPLSPPRALLPAPATDLTADEEEGRSVPLPLAPEQATKLSHFFTATEMKAKASAPFLPQWKRLPGGVRNLGNTCYIGATVQALCAQKVLRDRLSGPFWPSLIALQDAVPKANVISVSDGLRSGGIAGPAANVCAVAGASEDVDLNESDGLVRQQGSELEGSSVDVVSAPISGGQNSDKRAGNVQSSASAASAVAGAVVADDALAKYRQHSVLREMCNLIRMMGDFERQASAQGSGSCGAYSGYQTSTIAKVLDVTRLKNAVSSHTQKYRGFSQQDAHEFLADVLLLLEDETRVRWAAFCAQWLAQHSAPEADGGGVSGVEDTRSESSETALSFTTCRYTEDSGGDKLSQGVHTPDSDAVASGRGKRILQEDAAMGATTKKPRQDGSGASLASSVAPAPTQPLLVAESFESSVAVQMRCLGCGYEHPTKQELYQHFSLDLRSGTQSMQQLGGLLRSFFGEETRELSCERCAAKTNSGASAASPDTVTIPLSASKPSSAATSRGQAMTQMFLSTAPRTLVLHLKRFRYDPQSRDMVKVHTEVEFPAQLDLSEFMRDAGHTGGNCGTGNSSGGTSVMSTDLNAVDMSGDVWRTPAAKVLSSNVHPEQLLALHSATCAPPASGKYALTAVVRHLGATERSGHYICDVRALARGEGEKENRRWRRCDDSNVTAVEEEVVLRERTDPYLLFYTAQA